MREHVEDVPVDVPGGGTPDETDFFAFEAVPERRVDGLCVRESFAYVAVVYDTGDDSHRYHAGATLDDFGRYVRQDLAAAV